MYTLTTLIYSSINIIIKLADILFNPDIGEDKPLQTELAFNNNRLMTTKASHSLFKATMNQLCNPFVKNKEWIIFVVKDKDVKQAHTLINQYKPCKYLIVPIKSNEAKWWVTEQSLNSNNCSGVVMFDENPQENFIKYQQLSKKMINGYLMVLTDKPSDIGLGEDLKQAA
ncbi:MAG: hypothetical protein KGN31_05505 [Betaproteobacteria bacterium]|nr:hypothetical protein [Betaproteobacteria bacterium]MDE2423649.1 hypothetical protein [Betaproteobacteria bacterium]